MRKLRDNIRWTQTRLANELDYETPRQVARMEAGEVPVTLDLIEDVAAALGCGPEPFLRSLFPAAHPPMDTAEVEKRLLQLALDNRDRALQRALRRENVRNAALAIALLPDPQVDTLVLMARALTWAPVTEEVWSTEPPLLPDLPTTRSEGSSR